MKEYKKYKKQYFMPQEASLEWVKKESIEKAPKWCSVDLRDGNQSIVVPMSLQQKVKFFMLLCKTGFKEIEIGFPAASETEFLFTRELIEKNLIPPDVTIQVLTQAREHIIKKTFSALKGCKQAIVHVYNSTSKVQRQQVFKKNKSDILEIAKNGARWLVEYSKKTKGNFRFEYSPESFTGTELDFALEVCNSVLDIFSPTKEKKAIINLPATVEHSMPHVFASQIEWMNKRLKYRDCIELSLHNHNDRGTAVAATELALLAGADRVEGTFFGNGERTGNVDIITLAGNLYSQGVNPQLDLSKMSEIVSLYQEVTGLKVPDRAPYAGNLVFSAFSGSHQDAIKKGLEYKELNNEEGWSIPYLPIDPLDVGRVLETSVIRINSQSGKGGVSFVLERLGYKLPAKMCEAVSYAIKATSDAQHKELSPNEVEKRFKELFVDKESPISVAEYHYNKVKKEIEVDIVFHKENKKIIGSGNGRLDAFINALASFLNISICELEYSQHALGKDSKSKAISYVTAKINNKFYYGAGTDTDVTVSAMAAVLACVNSLNFD